MGVSAVSSPGAAGGELFVLFSMSSSNVRLTSTFRGLPDLIAFHHMTFRHSHSQKEHRATLGDSAHGFRPRPRHMDNDRFLVTEDILVGTR